VNKDKGKDSEFTVVVTANGHDSPGTTPSFSWMLSERATAKGGSELGGLGERDNLKEVARDICMTVWEDIDPNHYKKPGVTIEH
jgi:hypothetical protein